MLLTVITPDVTGVSIFTELEFNTADVSTATAFVPVKVPAVICSPSSRVPEDSETFRLEVEPVELEVKETFPAAASYVAEAPLPLPFILARMSFNESESDQFIFTPLIVIVPEEPVVPARFEDCDDKDWEARKVFPDELTGALLVSMALNAVVLVPV